MNHTGTNTNNTNIANDIYICVYTYIIKYRNYASNGVLWIDPIWPEIVGGAPKPTTTENNKGQVRSDLSLHEMSNSVRIASTKKTAKRGTPSPRAKCGAAVRATFLGALRSCCGRCARGL